MVYSPSYNSFKIYHTAVIYKMLLIGAGETALNPMYTFLKMSLHILHMMPLWLPKDYYNYIM